MRNCVQIGLFETCEYLYLTEHNWRAYNTANSLKTLPYSMRINPDEWRYIGIDKYENSINNMKMKNKSNDNVHWICAEIGSRNNQISLDTLCQCYNLESIDVLAIDVEGAELDILENWSWNPTPHFIAVEVHTNFGIDCDKFRSYIESKGYKLVLSEPTNHHATVEYQFILP